ncbi:MAG: hypothetical protein ACO3JL_03365 [Myxococcota bacterium]
MMFRRERPRSLVPLLFKGAVSTRQSARWVQSKAGGRLGAGSDAASPRHANLLVVCGDISQKAAPVLQRLFTRMAEPCQVLWICTRKALAPQTGYALVDDLRWVLPVDVILLGDPPTDADLEAALRQLEAAPHLRREAS